MSDKTALFRKASFALGGVLTGVIFVLFSISAARASVPTPPAANAQHVKGPMFSPISITLTGSDANGDTLTYEIIQPPAHGTLSGTPPDVTYTATGNEVSDSFTFRASDGTYVSSPAVVRVDRFIEPEKNNVAPMGQSQVLNASGGPVAINLTGSDAEGDAIVFQTVDSPGCGALSGTSPNFIYTFSPGDDYNCNNYAQTDGFSFKTQGSDGRSSGDLTRVDIYLTGNPPGPVTNVGGDIKVNPGNSVILNGTFHDPAGGEIAYQNWTCTDPVGKYCYETGWFEQYPDDEYASSDCTLDNAYGANPTLGVSATGIFKCDYYASNTSYVSSYDVIEVDSEENSPSAQTGSILLLVAFCALIGVRFVRKNARQNVSVLAVLIFAALLLTGVQAAWAYTALIYSPAHPSTSYSVNFNTFEELFAAIKADPPGNHISGFNQANDPLKVEMNYGGAMVTVDIPTGSTDVTVAVPALGSTKTFTEPTRAASFISAETEFTADPNGLVAGLGSYVAAGATQPWYGGDVNGDNKVDLTDAVTVLGVLAGLELPTGAIRADYANSEIDVNGDNIVGFEEIIYILQDISGLR
ncbi:Ig-like domain-containing protein [Thermodesulfobacteriota bacterium]